MGLLLLSKGEGITVPGVEMVSTATISGYERNARTHSDEQIDQLRASIREFGFYNPVIVNGDYRLIAGHGRLAAARLEGLDAVPTIRLDHLTEDQERALVLADNRLAESAGWDEDLLAQELAALGESGFSLPVIGFDDNEVERLLASLEIDPEPPALIGDPDAAPEPEDVAVSRPGDVWQLGDHLVMCGDATDPFVVSELCAGDDGVDAVWTDPPYNVNYSAAAGTVANDNMGDAEFREFLTCAFKAAASVMKAGAPIYVAHADTEGLNFRAAFNDAALKLSGCLVWVKPSLVLGSSDYQWRHEPILYGWKPGAAHRWFGGRSETTVVEADGKSVRLMPDGSVQVDVGDQVVIVRGDGLSLEAVVPSVLRVDKPSRNAEHPTMKPVELIARQLRNSAERGSVVLDIFGGSGSTLIACETLGMRARLVELEPRFADVIVRRFQDATGKTARRRADGATFEEASACAAGEAA